MALSSSLKFYGYKIHKWLVYLAVAAICVYSLSGITHPVMAWFGAKQLQFRPPVIGQNTSETIKNIPDIFIKHHLGKASLVKIVPTHNQQTLLQITQEFNHPRRYFDLLTQKELNDYDQLQAQFVGEYYTGLAKEKIKSIEFITTFNAEYPSINKLLPVYKITYDTPDNIVAFVDTEISQLASISNDFQRTTQMIFQNLHTLSFLDDYEFLRVTIAIVLLISLFTMLITGVILLYTMNKRQISDTKRKFHRILAHIVWIPLFLFIISGIYHLLHYAFEKEENNHRFIKPFSVENNLAKPNIPVKNINDLTLVTYQDKLYYRISEAAEALSVDEHAHHDLKNKKFDGLSREKSALYVNTQTGQPENLTDMDIVKEYATLYRDAPIIAIDKISFFGMGYDFRNKRLPVYKVIYDTPKGDILFIDPATGLLVDASNTNRALENLSFSFLHKWNFALMFTTREIRDVVIVTILGLVFILTALGLIIKLTSKRNGRVS